MPKSNAEHQRDHKARLKAQNLTRREYWATKQHHEALKAYLAKLKAKEGGK